MGITVEKGGGPHLLRRFQMKILLQRVNVHTLTLKAVKRKGQK